MYIRIDFSLGLHDDFFTSQISESLCVNREIAAVSVSPFRFCAKTLPNLVTRGGPNRAGLLEHGSLERAT